MGCDIQPWASPQDRRRAATNAEDPYCEFDVSRTEGSPVPKSFPSRDSQHDAHIHNYLPTLLSSMGQSALQLTLYIARGTAIDLVHRSRRLGRNVKWKQDGGQPTPEKFPLSRLPTRGTHSYNLHPTLLSSMGQPTARLGRPKKPKGTTGTARNWEASQKRHAKVPQATTPDPCSDCSEQKITSPSSEQSQLCSKRFPLQLRRGNQRHGQATLRH